MDVKVTKADDGTFGYVCEEQGVCGGPKGKYSSTGWPTAVLAGKRGAQHIEEHKTKIPMQALHEFRNENGVREDGTLI